MYLDVTSLMNTKLAEFLLLCNHHQPRPRQEPADHGGYGGISQSRPFSGQTTASPPMANTLDAFFLGCCLDELLELFPSPLTCHFWGLSIRCVWLRRVALSCCSHSCRLRNLEAAPDTTTLHSTNELLIIRRPSISAPIV